MGIMKKLDKQFTTLAELYRQELDTEEPKPSEPHSMWRDDFTAMPETQPVPLTVDILGEATTSSFEVKHE